MIQKIAEAVFPPEMQWVNYGGGSNDEHVDMNEDKRKGYTTALDHAFKCFEWASMNGWAYSAGQQKWVDYMYTQELTTPEMYDYWFNNVKSKEK